jgi:hypothetical protein
MKFGISTFLHRDRPLTHLYLVDIDAGGFESIELCGRPIRPASPAFSRQDRLASGNYFAPENLMRRHACVSPRNSPKRRRETRTLLV